jgi:hypothetical protein
MWDLWWTKWHWDRFFSEFFGFPLSIHNSTVDLQTHIIWGMRNMLAQRQASTLVSDPPHLQEKKINVAVALLKHAQYREMSMITRLQACELYTPSVLRVCWVATIAGS